MRTADVEECLGARVRWVETEHFLVGSTLRTYRLRGDQREAKKLDQELARLARRLARWKPPRNELDPWLRLHLYAQRLEEQHADFLRRFGLADADFAGPRAGTGAPSGQGPGYMGEGPWLGQERKFAVLLFDRSSHHGRFAKRWYAREPTASYREWLPGGGVLLAVDAQAWREHGFELDAVLHCVVAHDLAMNQVEGLRKSWGAAPLWFRLGVAYGYSRRVDERWTVYAERTFRGAEGDSWVWEPRIRGLVSNKGGASWAEMLAWSDPARLKPHDHMLAWSRVDWLCGAKDADLRALALAFSERPAEVPEADRARVARERQVEALRAATGRSPEELDEAWRRHVLSRYPRG